MTLSDAIASRRGNNLDLLRLIAAISVVVSHAWPLAPGPWPLASAPPSPCRP